MKPGLNSENINDFSSSVVSAVKNSARFGEGILNGVIGDHLQKTSNGLSIDMQFYKEESPLLLTTESLLFHYPKISNKIIILVHGLVNDETIWNFPKQAQTNYGSLLQNDLDYTPFYVRYNTGIHISENGKLLSQLIKLLLKIYPIEIKDIVIIAHSMGGLVTRSACYYAPLQGADWIDKISRIFFLGTPHLGAPLEKFGNVLTHILKKIPISYTKVTGDIINLRSAGIKDLRYGYLTDEDWQNYHPDELLKNNKVVVPLLQDASYFLITGTLTEDSDDLINQWFGDALVRKESSIGRAVNRHHLAFNLKNHKEFAGFQHHKLVNSPLVYVQIRYWMSSKYKLKKLKSSETSCIVTSENIHYFPTKPVIKISKLKGVSALAKEGITEGLSKLEELNRRRLAYKILNHIPLVNVFSKEIENVQVGITEKMLRMAKSLVEKMK